jgi:serine-type D-Ala-D-Ala carboxypeptidase/endopeptidase (penicillin-binding protein 4)
VRSEPDLFNLIEWRHSVLTGPEGSGDGVMIYSTPYGGRVEAMGTVPMGARDFPVRGAVPNPPALAKRILERELAKQGVSFLGKPVLEDLDEVVLARHESVPLAVILNHMQAVSDNLEAQCVFLMMGVKQGKEPEVVLREYWEGKEVDFKGLRLLDGSGLARATMIRPVDLARVNFLARRAAYGERFLQSLPGNHDGSLRSKRGAMSGVRTEVGFMKRDGKEYTFALMGNGLRAGVDFWKLREGLLDGVGR